MSGGSLDGGCDCRMGNVGIHMSEDPYTRLDRILGEIAREGSREAELLESLKAVCERLQVELDMMPFKPGVSPVLDKAKRLIAEIEGT